MNTIAKRRAVALLAALSSFAGVSLAAAPAHAADTRPTIEYTGRTPANENGWNNGTVTVEWRCTWADGNVYDITREVSEEGENQFVTGTCEQPDGSRAQDTQGGINVDYTAPEIGFLGRTSANAAGWNKAPVTVRWTCEDSLSGAVSETVSKTLSKEGHAQSVQGTCRDLAGNDVTGSEVDRINIDLTAPYAELTDRTAANDAGWNNAPVSLTWTCLDDQSGPAFDESTITYATEGEAGEAVGRCADKAGNVFRPTETVNLDTTAPRTVLTSRTPANAAGWNNTAVDIEWTCEDDGSGPDNAGDQASLSAEGVDQSATGTCTDVAGNSSTDTVDDVKIDLTAPVVEWTGGPEDGSSHYFGKVPAATCFTGDLLSGEGDCTVTDDSTVVGPHTLTATATDVAGNQATDTRSFTVKSWRTDGFVGAKPAKAIAPKATRTLTFQVFAGGKQLKSTKLVDAQFSQRRISCTTGDPIQPAREAIGDLGTRYANSVFTATWKAPARTGCYKVRADLADGSRLFTSFQVK